MTRQLWMINHYASRPGEAGIRHFSLAKALRTHGWETTILAASTQHYTGVQRVSGWSRQMTESIDGVKFRWLRVPAYGGNGILRVLNMVAFFFAVCLPGATRDLARPDAIIGSSVHPLAALGGARLARRNGVPFYFEIRDLWPETLIQMGALQRNGMGARLMRRLERYLCSQAKTVITTMPFAYEYLKEQGVPKEKVLWISNGVHVDEFEGAEKEETHEFVFVYFGALGTANCVDVLIDAFAGLGDARGAQLRIVGSGPTADALRTQVVRLGIGNRVSIEGRIPKTAIAELAAHADCLVVGLLPLPLYEYGISLNKLYEYMAAGRPIVFAGSARGNPVELSGGGVCSDGSVEQTTEAMATVMNADAALRRSWGVANRQYVSQHFDFSALAVLLARELEADG